MRSGRREPAQFVFVLGLLVVVVALVTSSNAAFGVGDILIGAAIGLFARKGAPPGSRSPQLYLIGLVAASVAAILDGILTLADQTDVAGALTFVVVAGAIIAFVGYGPPRR
jgi:peptidoglycan/LPS O-acetylase OafA/YrhL